MKIIVTIFAVLTLGIASLCYAADLIHGRAVYGTNCAICHGESGKGDGPRAAEFQPAPTNFTAPQAMQAVTPERFEKSVVEGLPDVTWHTFGNLLTHEDVGDVTYYVRSFIR